MKQADIELTCDHQIVERCENLYLTFSRHDSSFVRGGQIIINYTIYDGFDRVIEHRQQYLYDEFAMDVIAVEHCGFYRIEIDKIYCFDILNCLHLKRSIIHSLHVYVFPSLVVVNTDLQETLGMSIEANEYSPYQKGDDYSEIFELRSYRDNDSLKHIHWKASLKKDELFVKVGSQPIIKKILLAVDLHHDTSDDSALDIFYSLCLKFLQHNIQFEILSPQAHSNLPQPEFILHSDHLKDCIKRILKDKDYDFHYALTSTNDYLSLYVVTSQGIEVHEK